MRPVHRLAGLAAAALIISAAAALSACRDEIPAVGGGAAMVSENGADRDQVGSTRAPEQLSDAYMHWGVSEGSSQGFGWRHAYVGYQLGDLGRGPDLTVSCSHSTVSLDRRLSLSNLPWSGERQVTLQITLDNQAPLAHDVWLSTYRMFGPDSGSELRATAVLDDSQWYETLRSAEMLTILLLDSELEPFSIDLTRFFGTPIQEEIDNCGTDQATGEATQ